MRNHTIHACRHSGCQVLGRRHPLAIMVRSACPPRRRDRGTISHGGSLRHGGAIKKSAIDADMLADQLKLYVKEVGVKVAFDFGEYKSTWISCAVRGKALAKIWPYVKAILAVDARASIPYATAKVSIKNTLMAHPEARISSNSYEEDASQLAKQTVVIQTHVRRFCYHSSEANACLDRVLQETSGYPKLHDHILEMHRICGQAWKEHPNGGDERAESARSEDDLRSLFDDIATESSSDGADLMDIFNGLTEDEEDAEEPRPGKSKAKATTVKKPSACIDEDPKIHIGSVRLEGPFPSGSCYIRHKPDGVKLQCLVNLDKSSCGNNGEIMKKVLEFIVKNPGLRKSDAVNEKTRLVKRFDA